MKIFIYEFKKLLRFPLLWVLSALFIALNLVLTHTSVGHDDFQRNLHEMHDVLLGRSSEGGAFELYAQYRENYAGAYDELDMLKQLEMKKESLGFEPTGGYEKFIRGNYERIPCGSAGK